MSQGVWTARGDRGRQDRSEGVFAGEALPTTYTNTNANDNTNDTAATMPLCSTTTTLIHFLFKVAGTAGMGPGGGPSSSGEPRGGRADHPQEDPEQDEDYMEEVEEGVHATCR